MFTIAGDKVALGPLRRDLLPLYQKWMNDFEVIRTLGARLVPMTREAEQGWLERALTPGERDVSFTIYERGTARPVGNAGLHEIDLLHGTGTFGILIGEKDCWGRGYGTETARLVLDYGFNALNLHNIMLTVDASNERGLRAYLRAGFREIGRRREARRRAGGVEDTVYMDCLASEFESPMLARLLTER